MPTSKLRGGNLTRVQPAANRRIVRCRVRIEPVNHSIKRGRIVHETNRPRKAGSCDGVMDVCWELHNFRVLLTPWQPLL